MVEVYTTPGCRFCTRAKSFLTRQGIDYSEIDVSESKRLLDDMIRRAGAATLPQIFVEGEHIGGCTELLSEAGIAMLVQAGMEVRDVEPEAPAGRASAGCDAVSSPIIDADRSGSALNAAIIGASGTATSASASDLSADLQKRMLTLMDEHLSTDGSRVDYAGLRIAPAFASFCDAVGTLRELPLESLGVDSALEDRTAFWINLYNVLVLHATAVIGAPTDAAQRTAFFTGTSGAAYIIGGQRFSLDEIEHGMLRANALPVGATEPLLAVDDPRTCLALPMVDPRIHFALNCGARSCPPIKFYRADRLDESLALSARAFLEADLECWLGADGSPQLTCTKLLEWYGIDFGATVNARVERLRTMLADGSHKRSELDKILAAPGDVRVVYRPYDWSSNGVQIE